MEEREENKMWLVRHLEVTRKLVIDDLRVVKVSPDFSPLRSQTNITEMVCVC